MIEKIGVAHLINSTVVKVGSIQKYLKYLVFLKYGTKYQKVGSNTNLIFINTFHRSTARKKFKIKVPKNTHWYFL